MARDVARALDRLLGKGRGRVDVLVVSEHEWSRRLVVGVGGGEGFWGLARSG